MKMMKSGLVVLMLTMAGMFSGAVSANVDTEAQSLYFLPIDYGCGEE